MAAGYMRSQGREAAGCASCASWAWEKVLLAWLQPASRACATLHVRRRRQGNAGLAAPVPTSVGHALHVRRAGCRHVGWATSGGAHLVTARDMKEFLSFGIAVPCRMFEYCYFANLLSLYHLFLAPQSALLRKARGAGTGRHGRRGGGCCCSVRGPASVV